MGVLLVLLVIFLLLLAVLLGLSVGIAFLLNWLLPAVGLQMALLVAVIAVGQTMLIFGRVLSMLPPPASGPEFEDEPPIIILDRELTLPRRRRRRT